ncbi:MAG: hypothetical protein IJX19_09435, partial [Clostridia bacterium]|nr:hypothetical protein [Clostridia bacterium]
LLQSEQSTSHPERRKISGGYFSQSNPTPGRATPQALGSTNDFCYPLFYSKCNFTVEIYWNSFVDPIVAPLLGFAPTSQNFDFKTLCVFSLRMTRLFFAWQRTLVAPEALTRQPFGRFRPRFNPLRMTRFFAKNSFLF